MSTVRWLVVACIAGAAIGLTGVLFGAWWAPFSVGLVIGILAPRARWALLAGAIAGVVSWAAPLVNEQARYGLARTATSLAAIMGFTGAGTIPLALTLLVALLLGLVGAWVGSAARSLLPRDRPLRPVEKLRDKRLEVVDPVLAKR